MTVLTNKINKKKLNKKQFLGAFVGACVALGGTVELCGVNVVMAAPADHATQQNTTQGISEAESFLTKGIMLAQQKRFAEAIIAYNKAETIAEAKDWPALIGNVLVNKGVALIGLHRSAEALSVYDDIIHRFGTM